MNLRNITFTAIICSMHFIVIWPTSLGAQQDEIHFTGLIGWAQKPGANAYWAFMVDADCDTSSDPSAPGTSFCPGMEHEPYLLFHNAKFSTPPPNFSSHGIYVNTSGKVDDPGTNLDGFSLKGSTLDFDLNPATLTSSNMKYLLSGDDIAPGFKLEIDPSFFTTHPAPPSGSDTDYLQAVIIVDSGELRAADHPPLGCREKIQTTPEYNLQTHSTPCGGTPRYYSEDVFLYANAGGISFKLNGMQFSVERVDVSMPLKIFVMNIHPPSWRGLYAVPARYCSPPHHDALRWLYGLAKEPPITEYNNHYYTCNTGPSKAANRRCPQILFN